MQFPVQPMPQQPPLIGGINNALGIYAKLQQAMAAPEQMKMQRAIQQANLQKQQMANQYYPQNMQSQMALRQAQIEAMQNKGPSYGSGIGKQIGDRMNFIKQFGEDSPQVKMFDKQMEAVNSAAASRSGYYDKLANSIALRYATPQARAQVQSYLQNVLRLPTEKAIQVAADPARYFPIGENGDLDFTKFQDQPQAPMQGQQPQGMVGQQAPQGSAPMQGAQPQGMGAQPMPPIAPQMIPPQGGAGMGSPGMGAPAGMPVNPSAMQQGAQANPQLAQRLGVMPGQPQPQMVPQAAQGGNAISPALSQLTGQLTPEEKQRAAQQGSETQAGIEAKIIPTQQQNAIYAANRARTYANSLIKEMPNAMQYFNPAGALRLTKDQLNSLVTGKAPKGLEQLANFKSDLDNYKLEAASMLKVPADQQARGDFGSAFDLNKWYTNPDLAQKSLMHIIQKVTDAEKLNVQNISQARAQSESPLPGIGQALNQRAGALGAQAAAPVNIPTFNSKAEAQAWLKNKSPAELAAIKQQIGNK